MEMGDTKLKLIKTGGHIFESAAAYRLFKKTNPDFTDKFWEPYADKKWWQFWRI